jgi:hypothetical protein
LVHFGVIWYILHDLVSYAKKDLATLSCSRGPPAPLLRYKRYFRFSQAKWSSAKNESNKKERIEVTCHELESRQDTLYVGWQFCI